tara:strand:- start:1539 stop:1826 length:288 start_codon:yes stop_codon:yes gene_type:complete
MYPIDIVGVGICVGVGITNGLGIAVGLAVGATWSIRASFSLLSSIVISAGIKKAFSESGCEHPEITAKKIRAAAVYFIKIVILFFGFIMLVSGDA